MGIRRNWGPPVAQMEFSLGEQGAAEDRLHLQNLGAGHGEGAGKRI